MPTKCLFCPVECEEDIKGAFICKECLRNGLVDLAVNGDEQAKKVLERNKF